jgi:hypothetical protein
MTWLYTAVLGWLLGFLMGVYLLDLLDLLASLLA